MDIPTTTKVLVQIVFQEKTPNIHRRLELRHCRLRPYFNASTARFHTPRRSTACNSTTEIAVFAEVN